MIVNSACMLESIIVEYRSSLRIQFSLFDPLIYLLVVWFPLRVAQEIDEESKLIEGLKKIRGIAKATRTLVNMNSFERSESVKNVAKTGENRDANHICESEPVARLNTRSQSCGAICQLSSEKVFDQQARPSLSFADVLQLQSVYECRDRFLMDAEKACTDPLDWNKHGSADMSQSRLVDEERLDAKSNDLNQSKLNRHTRIIAQSCQNMDRFQEQRLNATGGRITDWTVLIPAVLAAKSDQKSARSNSFISDTHSTEKQLPGEPPDCFPRTFYQR